MKHFFIFIFLFLMASFVGAQDMPPLPSDASSSAVPSKDDSVPVLTNVGATTTPSVQDTPVSTSSNLMPSLPSQGTSTAPVSSSSDEGMPVLPDSSVAPVHSTPSAGSTSMPPLPSSSPTPNSVAPPSSSENSSIHSATTQKVVRRIHSRKPWQESFNRPRAIFGAWVRASGDVTDRLAWVSQQVLNAMDRKGYSLFTEEGVYPGEINKGPQYRKFTFSLSHSKNTVIIFLKPVGGKIGLRVGPDEEPAPADHTYAQVETIRRQDLRVFHILKMKFGRRFRPHYMPVSW